MNFISIAVYVLLLLSFVPGLKLAPRRGFNEDSLSLDAMTSLKGVLAIFVLCHHLSQKPAFQQTHTIGIFEHIGFLFVGVFFLCSGYGLYKSYLKKPDYLKSFLKRRVLPIVIFYYVMIAIYAVYHLIQGSAFTPVEWALKLSGLVMINSQCWYVIVILIFYLAFYFIYKSERLRKYGIPLFIVISLFFGILFCIIGHFPWYASPKNWWMNPKKFASIPWWKGPCALPFEGEWWVNSMFGFVAGLFIAKYEDKFIEWSSKNYGLKLAVTFLILLAVSAAGFFCLFCISFWSEFAFNGKLGILNKFICYAAQCIQVVVTDFFVVLVMRKVYVKNTFYNFFGKRSLEVYLMQELALFSWLYLIQSGEKAIFKAHNWNIALYAVLVTLTVFVSAIIYHWINVQLTKKLKKS
ncbi:MAG: acyltransferase [Treponema sp.]|uniref:acyltransferase n=1 Tax=Treponema sp. TaxID=166 RepID=UPI00298D8963|nr:acyltransferase [Treponema sp.]MBR5933621.1 acyltransferase [Treponema sp.]